VTPQPKRYITEEEYLEFEQSSVIKHEYYDGEVYAMTGGTDAHNSLSGNAYASLHAQLRKRPCKVYNSDQKIKVMATGLHTYPDVTVVCGRPEFIDRPRLTLINPVVIIEVLSPSTERYDRGMKFQNYRTIPTLQDYLLISQDNHRIEHYIRQENNEWLLREAVGLDAYIVLHSIECTLTLEDVYEKVNFEEEDASISRNAQVGEDDIMA
jgi:Uma2 family endonuclease